MPYEVRTRQVGDCAVVELGQADAIFFRQFPRFRVADRITVIPPNWFERMILRRTFWLKVDGAKRKLTRKAGKLNAKELVVVMPTVTVELPPVPPWPKAKANPR